MSVLTERWPWVDRCFSDLPPGACASSSAALLRADSDSSRGVSYEASGAAFKRNRERTGRGLIVGDEGEGRRGGAVGRRCHRRGTPRGPGENPVARQVQREQVNGATESIEALDCDRIAR